MKINRLLAKMQEINGSQYTDELLLMWVNELETTLHEYIKNNYEELVEDERVPAVMESEMLVDEPSLYIEYLAHKVDFANGEYERGNNHAAMYNALLTDWRERFFREHADSVSVGASDYIRGL